MKPRARISPARRQRHRTCRLKPKPDTLDKGCHLHVFVEARRQSNWIFERNTKQLLFEPWTTIPPPPPKERPQRRKKLHDTPRPNRRTVDEIWREKEEDGFYDFFIHCNHCIMFMNKLLLAPGVFGRQATRNNLLATPHECSLSPKR